MHGAPVCPRATLLCSAGAGACSLVHAERPRLDAVAHSDNPLHTPALPEWLRADGVAERVNSETATIPPFASLQHENLLYPILIR